MDILCKQVYLHRCIISTWLLICIIAKLQGFVHGEKCIKLEGKIRRDFSIKFSHLNSFVAELHAPRACTGNTMGKKNNGNPSVQRKFGFGHRKTTSPCMPVWPVSHDHFFFKVDRWPSTRFWLVGSQAQANLTFVRMNNPGAPAIRLS